NNSEHLPRFTKPLEFMNSGRFKRDPRAFQQMLRSRRNQHLASPRNTRNPCGFMHSEASYIISDELDLAGVNPRANRDTEPRDRSSDRPRASDRSRGAVEHCEESIAGGLYLAPSKAVQLEPHLMVMLQQQLAPGRVAKPPQMRGRVHDIGAQYRGEHAIAVGWRRINPGTRELDRLERLVSRDRCI